ncbi:hypothetical protein [Lentzea flava]|nr:hypothetical protein [Lentzea flava]MCP2199938.1 hypothetical protein [Lentzea flava]
MTADAPRKHGHAVNAVEQGDPEYSPSGVDQIVQDENRLRSRTAGDFGMRWALSAVGHQLKAESELVEDALQLIVAHEDKQVLVSAASLMATILLDGVPRDQLRSPIKLPVSFALPNDIEAEDRHAWQENVKVASAVVSAYAARDPDAIEEAVAALHGDGVFEVLAVLVAAAARKLERHATWFGEALRCTEVPTTGSTGVATQE